MPLIIEAITLNLELIQMLIWYTLEPYCTIIIELYMLRIQLLPLGNTIPIPNILNLIPTYRSIENYSKP
jgi:hypothetical protein